LAIGRSLLPWLRLLAARVRRDRRINILSAVVVAAAFLGAVQTAAAATVTITITGTLTGSGVGIDSFPVFGFPAGASLAGQPFVLVYTFDDTKGEVTLDPPVQSEISGTGASTPGTAVLWINGQSYCFCQQSSSSVPSH
jgi:hypothetical protein